MKKLFLFVLTVMVFWISFAQKRNKITTTRPNIIVFLVDDMGWLDTSVPFADQIMPLNKVYKTPNMDHLAKEGTKFTSAYAAPVCTPSRISMITGMNPAHHHVTNWTAIQPNVNTDALDEQFSSAMWNINGLSNSPQTPKTAYATTFPQLLKDSGYITIHVGKAHWAPNGTPGSNPLNLGFTVNIAGNSAGHPASYYAEDYYGNLKKSANGVPDLQEYYSSDTFLTEALTQEAIKAIETPIKNKQPFYLNMAHYAVHAPIMADKRFVQKYEEAGLDSSESKYASLIEGMDKSLGEIMDYLVKAKADKNTIIIFMSDNGGLALSPPRGGESSTQNLPLKSGKGSVYEGGIREPMIVKWPGVTTPSSVVSQPIIIEDFFPTILEMAGVRNYKTLQHIDGKSFVPLLKNNAGLKDDDRLFIWHYPNKWQSKEYPGINYKSAIRQGDWKLIYDMRTGNKELYNIKNDIGENQNLSDKYPEKVKSLSTQLSNQLRHWKSPMPYLKATSEVAPMPDEVKDFID